MKQKSLPTNIGAYVPFVILLIVLALIFPRTAHFNYDYKKGSTWRYQTLVAEFDFPILKTQEQLDMETSRASEGIYPFFKASDSDRVGVIRGIEEISGAGNPELSAVLLPVIDTLYRAGVVTDDTEIASSSISIQRGRRVTTVPSSDVFSLSDARARILQDARASMPDRNVDSLLKAYKVYDLIVPDLLFDKQTTDLVRAERLSSISPTSGYMSTGQTIVSKNEIITAEVQQLLDSYKTEFESSLGYGKPEALLWAGNFLIAIVLTILLFLAVYFTNDRIFLEMNRLYYIIFIFLLTCIAVLVVGGINERAMFLFPFSLAALYLQAFFKNRVIISVYLVSLLPLLLFSRYGVQLYLIFSSGGLLSIYLFQYFGKGWQQFITAIASFFLMEVAFMGFWMNDMISLSPLRISLYLAVACLLSVAGYPLVFVFERMFNLMSSTRLQELADTGNPLLRELNEKAPGTYQHSIQVMAMAEAAARAIDANVLVVRVGALYHDIGKMSNPACFVENESLLLADGEGGYHDGISPLQSAQDIIRHVTEGLELAEKKHLPQLVQDFIRSHHGDAAVSYFYNKHLSEGGSSEDYHRFVYPGMKPATKEQMILMLCDSVEAASRTLRMRNEETFGNLVESIVQSKIDTGQFEACEISIMELNMVKAEIKNYLAQLYHRRVAYPKPQ